VKNGSREAYSVDFHTLCATLRGGQAAQAPKNCLPRICQCLPALATKLSMISINDKWTLDNTVGGMEYQLANRLPLQQETIQISETTKTEYTLWIREFILVSLS